ncbi:MAG: 3-hydroxyacyl-CoA dehydrogenase family protein [Desulfobacterales bacterium]|nr:3-hydroxyacyl-CoA dehydrogenase family protein [Desulfobacterales bacterium]
MSIDNIFIVGAGLMGGGIAQVCAQAGLEVTITDISTEGMDRAIENIAWSLGKLIEKGQVEGRLENILSRIKKSDDYEPAREADLCLEVVFENLDAKRQVFERLDSLAPSESLIGSNTSAISISELATCTKRPEQVLGLHFFSPVPMMAAVEVIRGMLTSDKTFAAGEAFVRRLGKEPILVNNDVPGFIINRINLRANMEAMRLVEAGVAAVEDIDKGLRLAAGRKMGPFETGDMVGLDVSYGALMAIYEETKDPAWYPPAILRRKVKAGHLGRKTGRGWYEYNEDGSKKDMA